MLAFVILILGIALRIIPHTPNFSPLIAIALFSGVYLNKRYNLWLPLLLIILSDLIIGLHQVILFTWGAIFLITLLGIFLRKYKNTLTVIFSSILGAFAFFIITNFGVWILGWYPQNLTGLIGCYIMALPFFRITLMSTIFYVTCFFGIYELLAFLAKKHSLVKILVD